MKLEGGHQSASKPFVGLFLRLVAEVYDFKVAICNFPNGDPRPNNDLDL